MTSREPSGERLGPVSHPMRELGKGGPRIGPLAWGMWRFRGTDVAAAQRIVECALENGLTLFDTADVYGLDNGESFGAAEELLGRVFGSSPSLRSRITLATKAGIAPGVPYNSSATYLVDACESALRRLKVEQIDLLQIHRPDLLAHPVEVAEAFDRIRQRGYARSFGVSNYTAFQYETLRQFVTSPLVSIQPELSPLAIGGFSDGLLDCALRDNLTVLAWSPFAGGRLGSPRSARERAVAEVIGKIATREGASPAAVSYAWVMAHPSRPIPIVGSQTPARISQARDALAVRLSRADWYAILEASRQEPLP